jgi:predicted  nucleic acid-binding Zn-ribbon protein
MPSPAAILREIHRLRRHARDLQDRIDQLPRLLKAQQARVTREEEGLQQAHDGLKRLKVGTHEKEVTLKTLQQQIKKHEKQLEEAGSRKEYDSLKAEIAATQDKVRRLEDDILNSMLETEEQTAKLPELEKAVRQARQDLARFETEQQARQAQLGEQLQQATAQISKVEGELPAGRPREDYDRLVRVRGEDAMSAVESGTCMACYTEITAQQKQELMQELLVVCKNCGRILYLPE